MATRPISPRPGRKLSPAVNIPQVNRTSGQGVSVPSPPSCFRPSSPRSPVATPPSHRDHNRGHGPSAGFLSPEGGSPPNQHPREPHPPSSPHPVAKETSGMLKSPVGSPDRTWITRQRRHTISLANPSMLLDPLQIRKGHPSDLLPFPETIELEGDRDANEDKSTVSELHRQPLPISSSSFQKAMKDLKRRPSGGSTSGDDEGRSQPNQGKASRHDDEQHRSTPVIEITEPKYSDYSLDIELTNSNVDDEVFEGDEDIELSRSARSESGLDAMTRTGKRQGRLGSADFAHRYPHSPGSDKRPGSGSPRQTDKITERANSRLKVPSPGLRPLRKWRSTEGSLPAVNVPHHLLPEKTHQSIHSPFISSPFLRRKMSLPLGALQANRRGSFNTDLRSLSEDGEKNRQNLKVSFRTQSSLDSGSDSSISPPPSPQMKRSASPRTHQEIVSPLNLKTAAQITRLITAAAASSTTPGGNKNQHLLPGKVTLPPVCNTSGRLLVNRRRDDSMRLVKQAVNLDNNIPLDHEVMAAAHHHDHHQRHPHQGSARTQRKGKHGNTSLFGFSEV